MINSKNLIFSIVAGLVSAVLAALALTRPGLLTLLIYVSAVPIFYASFARGSLSGAIAAVIAAVSTGLTGGFAIAAIVAITIVGPAAYGGYLTGLSRQDENGEVFWYPLSEILFRLALVVIAAYIVLGLWFGYDVALVAAQFEKFMREIMNMQNAVLGPKEEIAIRSNSVLYASLLPLVVPAFSFAILIWNMSLAERLARRKPGMKRPKDNIAADSGMPRRALILFIAALATSLLLPPLQGLSYVVVGTLGMAISMIGLAVLHYFTWGLKGRSQILFFTYVMLIALSLPIFLFLIVGIAELTFLLRARDPDRMSRVMKLPKNHK